MGEAIVLDPQNESVAFAPLWLHAPSLASGIQVSEHAYPEPEQDVTWATSPDTEGDLPVNARPQRRTITLALWVVEPVDAAATNKATNPTAGRDTAGWTNNSLTLMERRTTLPARLDGFDTAIHATGNADDDSAYLSAAVTNAVAETFTAWVYVVSGTVRLEAWNATPALNASSANITVGSWQRVTLPYTPTTTATYTFRVAQNGAGTCEFYVTGMQIGPADPYLDGDVAGCYWTGTRVASTSTRRASGGSRYAGVKADVESKIATVSVLRRTLPSGERISFDVLTARITAWREDVVAEQRRVIHADVELVCRPYGRGNVVTV